MERIDKAIKYMNKIKYTELIEDKWCIIRDLGNISELCCGTTYAFIGAINRRFSNAFTESELIYILNNIK